MAVASTYLKERNEALTQDLMRGHTPGEVAKKYQLSLPYIRSILREEGNDHLLDGAKPRIRRKKKIARTGHLTG